MKGTTLATYHQITNVSPSLLGGEFTCGRPTYVYKKSQRAHWNCV